MDSDVFTDQGGLSVHGIRDVRSTVDGKQHDWSEQAEATETDTLSTDLKSYTSVMLTLCSGVSVLVLTVAVLLTTLLLLNWNSDLIQV